MARRTKPEAAQTRHAILDAAEHEMNARGVSGASFARIAARAEVTRGAIYWHFEDRQALLSAMLARTYLPLRDLQNCLHSERPDHTPPQLLREMLLHGLHRLATDARHRRVCHIMLHRCEGADTHHVVGDLLRAVFEDSRSVVVALCRDAEGAGLLRSGQDPQQAGDVIMAFMSGVYNCSLRYPDLYSARRDWAQSVDALLDSLFRANPDQPNA